MDTNEMDALAARVRARRADAGLVAKDGVACPSVAHRRFHDFRHDMRARPDWGALPADLESELLRLRRAAYGGWG